MCVCVCVSVCVCVCVGGGHLKYSGTAKRRATISPVEGHFRCPGGVVWILSPWPALSRPLALYFTVLTKATIAVLRLKTIRLFKVQGKGKEPRSLEPGDTPYYKTTWLTVSGIENTRRRASLSFCTSFFFSFHNCLSCHGWIPVYIVCTVYCVCSSTPLGNWQRPARAPDL